MINLGAIATVHNDREDLRDDDWGEVISKIVLNENLSGDLLLGLSEFSHVEIIFLFHLKLVDQDMPATRHPRNNPQWPRIGRLAQRSVHHPNPIGHTSVKVIGVEGRTLTVKGLDAVNGTPVLDIKPVFREFLPKNIEQPTWVSELMEKYWTNV